MKTNPSSLERAEPAALAPRHLRPARRALHMVRIALLALLSVVWLALPDQAAAQSKAPPECSIRPKLTTKYENGLEAGRSKADALFAASDVGRSPAKLRKKMNRVLERLYDHVRQALLEGEREGRRCRVQGLADGYLGRLAELLGECVFDGAQWGQFGATLYCDLAIELDGLGEVTPFVRAPVGLCGQLFERMCDGVYAYVATEGAAPLAPEVRTFLQQRSLLPQPYLGCAPYTEDEYRASFLESVRIDCAYGP